ncbi:MAG TPA: TatA/E family twin arginine-targeting protein translocase [Nitrospirota bacterium]|jgi:Tat protein translocase TatB subunit
MFNIGMPELIVIFIVALLVFGPKRLPEIGKSLGRAMHQFKQATNEFKSNLEEEVGTTEIKEQLLKQQKEIQDKLAAIGTEAVAAATAAVAVPAEAAKTLETEAEYAAKAHENAEHKETKSETTGSHAG